MAAERKYEHLDVSFQTENAPFLAAVMKSTDSWKRELFNFQKNLTIKKVKDGGVEHTERECFDSRHHKQPLQHESGMEIQ